MYCKQCGFHSFDHLQACPKCGHTWETVRKSLGLQWIREPKGTWLESNDARTDSPKPAQQPLQDKASLLDEDAFMLEEDWNQPVSPSAASSAREETFTFDQEPSDQQTDPIPGADNSRIPFEPATPKDSIERATQKRHQQLDAQGATPEQPPSPFEDVAKDSRFRKTDTKGPDTRPGRTQGVEVVLEPESGTTTSSILKQPLHEPTSGHGQSPSQMMLDEMNDLIVPGLEEKLQAAQSHPHADASKPISSKPSPEPQIQEIELDPHELGIVPEDKDQTSSS
jgi:hypothetical protein